MFLETFRSEGLAHLSYLFGDGGEAAVVDPSRDIDRYLRAARAEDCRITHVFETHRNEDYLVGSREIARRTGATIHHGRGLDWKYGETAGDGDTFRVGPVEVRVLATPGHTDESLSFAIADTATGKDPIAVFTGDSLFIGSVGRTDFYPDRAREVAGLLFDSIHETLLPLGDGVILLPAHGAGSVCGGGMAPRDFSTLGYERRNNPMLQLDRDAFIRAKTTERHEQPPYFRRMEVRNLAGDAPPLDALTEPAPMTADRFAEAMEDGLVALDVRSPEAVAGAFVPGSVAIPLDMLATYAGWFVPDDPPLGLIAEKDDRGAVPEARLILARMGFERVAGYLAGGLDGWETSGRRYGRIPAVHVDELARRLEAKDPPVLLDVRTRDEVDEQALRDALHVPLRELIERLDEIPRDRPVVAFCGTGRRSLIAASLLKREGYEEVADALGSLSACVAAGCPLLAKEP
ncbi:MAG: MBL fold metallo-hydrolase [Candidatus Latescibacteria bacterium]|nr:MBL fold metallo-hydrolase [Candidatus Latescibacterota bacterium]